MNWYKIRQVNFEDEKECVADPYNPISFLKPHSWPYYRTSLELHRVEIPVLFIGAKHDVAVVPEMTMGQERYISNLTVRQVETSHWALTEKPELSIAHMDEWIDSVIFGGETKLWKIGFPLVDSSSPLASANV